MKYVLAIALLVIPAPSFAQAYPDRHDEWFQCQKDDDCVVGYNCFDTAVNKKYAGLLENHNCEKSGAHNPIAMAKCVNDKCVIVVSPIILPESKRPPYLLPVPISPPKAPQ